MAISGSGGAYYRGNANVPPSEGLHAAYTRHVFVKSSIAPPIAGVRTACGMVGDFNQEPHELFHFSSASQVHRNSTGGYITASMTPANFPVDTWVSVAAVFGSGTLSNYVNGVLDGSIGGGFSGDARSMSIDALAAITSAGALDSSSQFASGELAEYAVWNAPLTVAEIVALSRGLRALRVRPSALTFYAPLVRSFHDRVGGRFLNRLAGADVISAHPRVFG